MGNTCKSMAEDALIFTFIQVGGLVTKSCPTLATPWTEACQAPLSTGFSRQEYRLACNKLFNFLSKSDF